MSLLFRPRLSVAAALDVLERAAPATDLARGTRLGAAELVWVPLSLEHRNAQAETDRFAAVGGARLGPEPLEPGAPTEGRVLASRPGEEVLLRPVWSFSTGEGTDFVLVDAVDGRVWAADLPAAPLRAAVRLGLLLLVAVFSASVGAALVLEAIGFAQLVSLLGLASTSLWLARVAGLVASLWFLVLFARRLGRMREALFEEPILRVETQRIQGGTGPLPTLLRGAAVLVLASASAQVFEHALGRIQPHAPSLGWVFVTVGLAALFALASSRLAKQEGAPFVRPASAWARVDTPVRSLVRTSLSLLRYSLVAAVALYFVRSSLLFLSVWDGPSFSLPHVEPLVLNAAGVMALTRSTLERREKWIAAVSLSSLLLAKVLFGTVGAVVGPLVVVALAVRTAARASWRDALEATVGFNAAAAVGRLVGSLTGSALLGSFGLALGENLGEQLVSTLVLLRTRQRVTSTADERRREVPALEPRASLLSAGRLSVLLWAGPLALVGIVVAAMLNPFRGPPDHDVEVDPRPIEGWVRFQSAADAVEAYVPATPEEEHETWVREYKHLGPGARVEVPVRRLRVEHEGRTLAVLRGTVPRNGYMRTADPLLLLQDLLRPKHIQGVGQVLFGHLDDDTDLRAMAYVDGPDFWLLYTLSPSSKGKLFEGEAAFFLRSGRLLPDDTLRPLLDRADLERVADEHFRPYFDGFRRRLKPSPP